MKYHKSVKKLLLIPAMAACTSLIGVIIGFLLIKPVYLSEARYYITENTRKGIIYSSAELKPLLLSGTFYDTVSLKLGTRHTPKELKKMISIDTDTNSMFFTLKIKSTKPADVFQVHKTIENMISVYIKDATKEFLAIDLTEPACFPEKSHRPGLIWFGIFSSFPGTAGAVYILRKRKINYIVSPNDLTEKHKSFPVCASIPSYSLISDKPDFQKNSGKFNSAFRQLINRFKLDQLLADDKKSTYQPDGSTIKIGKESSTVFVTAFRNLYSETKRLTEKTKNIILITSPVSGEGKTTAAVNLGITIAAEGKKVLLIEGNMHNRRLTRAFGLSTSLKGLAEVSAGSITAKEAILITEYRSLYFMPAGNYSGNPLGLFTRSYTLNELYNLKGLFDYIIIDTPPLNAFSDALALTGIADIIYLTIRSGFTSEKETENALKSFQLSDIKMSGFILNDVSPDSRSFQQDKLINTSDNKFTSKINI